MASRARASGSAAMAIVTSIVYLCPDQIWVTPPQQLSVLHASSSGIDRWSAAGPSISSAQRCRRARIMSVAAAIVTPELPLSSIYLSLQLMVDGGGRRRGGGFWGWQVGPTCSSQGGIAQNFVFWWNSDGSTRSVWLTEANLKNPEWMSSCVGLIIWFYCPCWNGWHIALKMHFFSVSLDCVWMM